MKRRMRKLQFAQSEKHDSEEDEGREEQDK